MKKRLISLLLALILLLAAAPAGFAAEGSSPSPASGTYDFYDDEENLYVGSWSLDSDGTLTLRGQGSMEPIPGASLYPWADRRGDIRAVVVESGVTGISLYSFMDCENLRTLTLPVTVTSIAAEAFDGCSSLTDVWYGGTETQWADVWYDPEYNPPLAAARLHFADPLAIAGVRPDRADAAVGETVTWTALSSGGSGTVKYRFYLYKDGAVFQKGSYGAANTVSYTPGEPGTYTVRAYAKDESGTSVSFTGGAVTVKASASAAPTGVKLASSLEGITVSWDKAAGVTKYRVIRTVDGVTTKVKVTGTSYTDTAVEKDKTYVYSVQAQSADGTYSAESEAKSLYYPLGIAVKVSGKKANVSWTAVTGAAKYQVYRRPQVNGKYGDWVLVYSAKGTSFTDTPGAGTWQYRVRAVVDGTKTPYSNRKRVTIG